MALRRLIQWARSEAAAVPREVDLSHLPGIACSSSNAPAESGWIERIQRGDPVAVDWLVREHWGRAERLLVRLFGRRQDLEDLVQTTFLETLRALPNFRGLLDQAEAARRAGRHGEARDAYRAASQRRDDSGEVALLRWVRFELDVADPAAAQRVLKLHRQRFARGHLGAEAGWLEVQVQQALQRPDRAQTAARKLGAEYPGTPQAAAAAKVLGAP
jgi:DNA-directed RNA polymerase specialized sigma24 family protein